MNRICSAFCAAQPLVAGQAPCSAFSPRPRPLIYATPKRPRPATLRPSFSRSTNTPRAQFNQNNDRNTRFLNQTADLLLTAGRFFQSTSGQVFLWGGLVWLVLTGRIGVLFDSFLVLFAFLTIVPVIAVVIFRWWVSRSLIQGDCPNCGASVTALKGQSVQCASCGTTVTPEPSGSFSVKDPKSATIDIDAKQIDDY